MAVKFELDPKKDQVVPCKALKDFNKKFLVEAIKGDDAFKRLFAGEEKGKKEAIKKLSESISSLPDTGRVWFVKRFLVGFGNKVNDAAEEAFEELEKNNAFNELKTATEAYNGKLKDATLATANEAKSLQSTLINTFSPAVAEFSKKYIASKGVGASGAAPGTPPSGGAPGTPTGGTGGAAGGVVAAESIDRELYQSKKLLELGFITQNEYLAKLVEIKNIILEAATVPPPRLGTDMARRVFGPPGGGAPASPNPLRITPPTGPTILTPTALPAVPEDMTEDATPETAPPFDKKQAAPIAKQALDQAIRTNTSGNLLTKIQWKTQLLQSLRAAAIEAAQAQSITEAKKQLQLSKKLLEFGFITKSEYLANVLEFKTRLQEAATAGGAAPAAAPTVTSTGGAAPPVPTDEAGLDTALDTEFGYKKADVEGLWTDLVKDPAYKNQIDPRDIASATTPATPGADKADPVMQAIATLSGKEGQKDGEINKLVDASVGLQNTLTKFNETIVTEGFSLRQKQLAKLYVKKQVLSEYNKTGNFPTKTQLNEFFIASLLLAALAGVFAWAASKLGEIFKGAYAPSDTPQGYKSKDGPDLNKTITSIVSSLGAGYGADNKIVDINNNPVKGLKEELGALTTDLTAKREAINNCIDVIANTGGEAARFATYKDAIDTTRLTNSLNSLLNL